MKQLLIGIFMYMPLLTFGQNNKDLQDRIDNINSKYTELIGADNSNRSTGTRAEIKYAKYLEKSMDELITAINVMRNYFNTHDALSMEQPIVNVGGRAVGLRDELKGSLDYNEAGLKDGTINFRTERDNSITLWTNFIGLKDQYYQKEDDLRSGKTAQREIQQKKEDSIKTDIAEQEQYSLFKERMKSKNQPVYLCRSRTTCQYVPETMEWQPIEKSKLLCAFVLNGDKTQLVLYTGSEQIIYPITKKQFDNDKNTWEFSVTDNSGTEEHIIEINLQKNVIYSYYKGDHTSLYSFDIADVIK